MALIAAMATFEGSASAERRREIGLGGLPPASKAKQEFKDCEIFEEFLELMSLVRAQDDNAQAIFVTPNVNDYGPPPKGYTQVEEDLAPLNAQYCAHLSWARSLLR